METERKTAVLSKIEKKNMMVEEVQKQKQEEVERRRREESEKRRVIESEMVRLQAEKEREKEMRLKKIKEEDEVFNSRKRAERVAKEQVYYIKDTINVRKKEIVNEIKALRENYRIKLNGGSGNATSALGTFDSASQSSKLSLNNLSKSVTVSH